MHAASDAMAACNLLKACRPRALCHNLHHRISWYTSSAPCHYPADEPEEADTYRGPGGLTARDIFAAVQKGAAEGDPYWKSEETLKQQVASAAEHEQFYVDDLRKLSVGRLQEALQRRGLPFQDCLDKESLVERLEAVTKGTQKKEQK